MPKRNVVQKNNQNELANALDYESWLDEAEKQNILMTVEEFKQIEIGTSIKVIEVDYLLFSVSEGMKVQYNYLYDPVTFFANSKHVTILRPTGNVITSNLCNDNSVLCEVIMKGGLNRHDDDKRVCDYVEGDHYIGNGSSGDGYSRYISVEKLSLMPKFYFKDQ